MLEKDLDQIVQETESFLSTVTDKDCSLVSAPSTLVNIVYGHLCQLPEEEIVVLRKEFLKCVESCYLDPDEAPIGIAARFIVSNWLENRDNGNSTKEGGVFVDDLGVIYSEDKKVLISFPRTLSIEHYEVLDGCERITRDSFEEEIVDYGHSLEDMFVLSNSLKDVVLPKTVKEVSFHGCYKLERIEIPDSVISIDPPFTANFLNTIMVSDNNPIFDSRDNCNAIIRTATNEVLLGCSRTIIPKGISSVADSAFYASGIEHLIVPDTVRHIGAYAFHYCSKLKELSLLSREIVIDDRDKFLDRCHSLESIEIHSKIEGVTYKAFIGLESLKKILVPFDCYDYYRRLFSYTPIIQKLEVLFHGRDLPI